MVRTPKFQAGLPANFETMVLRNEFFKCSSGSAVSKLDADEICICSRTFAAGASAGLP